MSDSTNRPAANLSAMKLDELKQVASAMGIKGITKMRKGDLVEAITSRQSGGNGGRSNERTSDAAHAEAPRGARAARAQDAVREVQQAAGVTEQTPGQRRDHEPRDNSSESRERADGVDEERSQGRDGGRGGRGSRDQQRQNDRRNDRRDETTGGVESSGEGDRSGDGFDSNRSGDDESTQDAQDRQGDRQNNRKRQNQNNRGTQNDRNQNQRDRQNAKQNQGQNQSQGGQQHQQNEPDDEEQTTSRRSRNRQRSRDRKRGRGQGADWSEADLQIAEDDVLVPVAGILDVLDSYAFVRTSGYLPGPNDVYVPLAMVKRHGLRKGDAVMGAVKALREGEAPQGSVGRQKFNALVRLDSVNGMTPEEAQKRVEFDELTPLHPSERLRLETESGKVTARAMDLVTPIGKGQRAIIAAPRKSGASTLLRELAGAITKNNPECHLMVVLIDERPEDVTEMQRSVKGEVIASTFDRTAEDHTTVAELAIERAKRLVELGHDVVVLLDSITGLARAYNLAAPSGGRTMAGGIDATAVVPPKKWLAAARNAENGGSLTVVAVAETETGSEVDEAYVQDLASTANLTLRLNSELAARGVHPAIDLDASATSREDLLLTEQEIEALREARGGQTEDFLNRLGQTRTNYEFLTGAGRR